MNSKVRIAELEALRREQTRERVEFSQVSNRYCFNKAVVLKHLNGEHASGTHNPMRFLKVSS